MAVRLRLRRMGKKKQPFYRIVAIDSREARGGKYLENIGYYNPLPDPIELNVKVDRAIYWLQRGAQPSDTVRSLLRRKGVMLRYHLMKSGKSPEEIEQEYKKWEIIQEERQRKSEAAKVQAMREKMPKEEAPPEEQNSAEKSEPVAEDREGEAEARRTEPSTTGAEPPVAEQDAAQPEAEGENGSEKS